MKAVDTPPSFSGRTFTAPWQDAWAQASFYDSQFDGASFVEARLAGCRFVDCRFQTCDLSMAEVTDAVFQNVAFEDCRLLGINWSLAAHKVTPFAASFVRCLLDFSRFREMRLIEQRFDGCSFREAVFVNVDLQRASFVNAELSRCQFSRCDLRGADFRGARGYRIDPQQNAVRGARFSAGEVMGLLHGLEIVIE